MPQSAYAFHVRSLSHPGVSRTIELRGDQTLADLQGVMEAEFDLDDEHLWAFYLSGEWYDRESEFGRSGRAHDAELASLGLEPGLRIAHLHDFGEEWRHVVDVARVGEAQPGAEYPRVTARRGEIDAASPWEKEEEEDEESAPTSPDLIAQVRSAMAAYYSKDPEPRQRAFQAGAAAIDAAFDGCETMAALERLGRSVEGAFPEWFHGVVLQFAREGSTSRAVALVERLEILLGYEPFPATVLGEALEAAGAWDELDYEAEIELPSPRLAELVDGLLSAVPTPGRVEVLSNLVGRSLLTFLRRAVEQLAAARELGAARRVAAWLAEADDGPDELVALADLLARANLTAEARQLLAQAEAVPYAPSAQAAFAIAQGYAAARDDAAAEERLRKLAGRRWITAPDRDAVVGLLAQILERTGRASEARRVEVEHAAWHRSRHEARGGTVRRTEPRVGRNDPCPCGSGKKSKKCCGAGRSVQ